MTSEGSVATGRVKASGRVGEIVVHDPADADLTFKLRFSDGQEPAMDWFSANSVEVLGEVASLPSSNNLSASPADNQVTVAPAWAASRPVGTPIKDEGFICAGSKAPLCPAQARTPAAWAADKSARPAGTPIEDEGFICIGSKAPRCPAPSPQPMLGPITLQALQGEWVGSGGVQISVLGVEVTMNGLPLKDHKVEMREDGTVCSIGKLWQLDKWSPCGGIEFRASSTRENMECARLEVWTKKAGNGSDSWMEKMKLMGYAGSAANPLDRGVEGCMPGTDGIEKPSGYASLKDVEEVALLTALVKQWREPELCKVKSSQVIPDMTNRAETGLGVELVHFVATSMQQKGFQKRHGKRGHDIPVVVREPPSSANHTDAVKKWKVRVAEDEGFPPVRVDSSKDLFCSLGNGHFFQALNCFDCELSAINDTSRHYTVGNDAMLAEAVSDGVPSIVLRHEVPKPVRAKIAALLNSKREFHWALGEDGQPDFDNITENTDYCSQFEWLSKGMDAVQVDCLVRTHLGIKESKRIEG